MSIRVENYEKHFPPFVFHDKKYLQSNLPHYEPPYLKKENIKKPIDISIGRQLFIDNYLIENKINIKQKIYKAKLIDKPIINPELPYENGICAPLPDAVLYDPVSKEFKLWYVAVKAVRAAPLNVGIAKSYNGEKWYKPYILDNEFLVTEPCCKKCYNAKTEYEHYQRNLLGCFGGCRDRMGRGSGPIIMFPDRKKDRFLLYFGGFRKTSIYSSDDGIDWKKIGNGGSVSTCPWFASYNPFRKKIFFTLRDNITKYKNNRVFRYKEIENQLDTWGEWCTLTDIGSEGTIEKIKDSPVYWCMSSKEDSVYGNRIPGIYTTHMVPYESIMLNLMAVYHGGIDVNCNVDIHLGFSRDGFYYSRNFQTFIEQTDTAKYIIPTGGNVLFVDDKIYFYCVSKNKKKQTVTNLAKLRRDGFVSLSSDNEKTGIITTKLLIVPQKECYLFVNMNNNKNGSLSVEILDEKDNIINELSDKIIVDSTKVKVTWKNENKLNINKPFKLKFYLEGDCELYSFWISKYETGESMGFIGNGGPGYNSYCDNKIIPDKYCYERLQYICNENGEEKMYIQKLNFKASSIEKTENKICYIKTDTDIINEVALKNNAINIKLIL